MDQKRLEEALVAADAAGDVEAAKQLASALRSYTTRPAPKQTSYDPTEGMSFMDKTLAGAGKAFSDLGRGVAQVSKAYEARNFPADVRAAVDAPYRNAADEAKRLDAPLMRTGAGQAGNIVGNVAATAPLMFVPGVNTYGGAALAGGLMGAAQPVGTDDSRAMNTGMGAAGGMAGKFLGDRLASLATRPAVSAESQAASQAGANVNIGPSNAGAQTTATGAANVTGQGGGATFGTVGADASTGLSAAQQRAMTAGQALGMRTTPGQATGSRALQQMEAKLESQPMTSGPFNTIKEANQRVLNRATARAIGEEADVVDSTVLARANERLGAVFNDVRDATPRQIDSQAFVQRLQAINDDFEGLLPEGRPIQQNPLVQRLFRYAETGNATGEQLGGLTSKLGRAAHKEMTSPSGDREMGQALYQIKDYVDDLVEQGLSGERLTGYQAARGQYRNLINITKSIGIVNPSSGNVSGARLANALQKGDKSGFLFGNNNTDMYAAARFAQAFKPIVGDSGTATRSMVNGPMDFLVSLPFNIASRAYTSSPSVSAAVAAQAGARSAQQAASPLLRQSPNYLPIAGGLLGANAAR